MTGFKKIKIKETKKYKSNERNLQVIKENLKVIKEILKKQKKFKRNKRSLKDIFLKSYTRGHGLFIGTRMTSVVDF